MNALANAGVFFDSTFPENIHIVVKKGKWEAYVLSKNISAL